MIEVFFIPFYSNLPRIPIPSNTPKRKNTINLQKIIEECYPGENSGLMIDYLTEPVPPFDPKDAIWADKLLRNKGVRK